MNFPRIISARDSLPEFECCPRKPGAELFNTVGPSPDCLASDIGMAKPTFGQFVVARSADTNKAAVEVLAERP
jgi:hypothetical protein